MGKIFTSHISDKVLIIAKIHKELIQLNRKEIVFKNGTRVWIDIIQRKYTFSWKGASHH